MLRLGAGVSLFDFKAQALLAMHVTEQEFSALPSSPELLVTSCNDRVHMKDSYHGEGLAFDARTQSLGAGVDQHALISRIAGRLGEEFDVLLEDFGTPNAHLHIEFDRRRVEAKRVSLGLPLTHSL